MKISVLWFGRPAASPYESVVEGYRSKVHRRWPAEDIPLKAVAGGRDADPRRALKAEASSVRQKIPRGWRVVVLDEQGGTLDSERFAGMLADAENTGLPGIVFVIGSDIGIDSELLRSADSRLSIGPMTLPHLLARVVLWEQIFRATRILGGGGYHRHRVQ